MVRMPLDIEAEVRHLGVRFVAKKDSRLMRVCGWLLTWFVPGFMSWFWTTVRFPFQKNVVIYYPSSVSEPGWGDQIVIRHELVHARQQRPWWGPWWSGLLYFLAPLPVLLSGRWFIERHAYLGDIRAGAFTPETAARQLWRSYLWPWPRSWMQKWFEAQL